MKEKDMNEIPQNIWLSAIVDDEEIPAWKRLDIVTRKWAVLSGLENDLSKYQKIQEMYSFKK
jgi:hypothetical protein